RRAAPGSSVRHEDRATPAPSREARRTVQGLGAADLQRVRVPREAGGDRRAQVAVSSDFDINDFGPCSCPIRNQRGKIMPHWRSFVESKYISHFDLQGRDVNVQIAKVVKTPVVGKGGAKNQK